MENRITVDVYVEKKLSAEIAELKAQLARMEFQTLVLKEENEALKVWVYRALKIDRFSHLMYSWDFGNEVMTLVNQGYTPQLTKVEVKRFIEEALYVHPYIEDINITNIDFYNSALSVSMIITSIYGEVEFSV